MVVGLRYLFHWRAGRGWATLGRVLSELKGTRRASSQTASGASYKHTTEREWYKQCYHETPSQQFQQDSGQSSEMAKLGEYSLMFVTSSVQPYTRLIR
jgi:hypothetical protein